MKRRDARWKMARAMSGIFDGRPRKPKWGDDNTLRAVTVLWIAFEHPYRFRRTADVIRWLQDNVVDEAKISASEWIDFLKDSQIPLTSDLIENPQKKLKWLFPVPNSNTQSFSKIQQSVSRGMNANGRALKEQEKLARKSGYIYASDSQKT